MDPPDWQIQASEFDSDNSGYANERVQEWEDDNPFDSNQDFENGVLSSHAEDYSTVAANENAEDQAGWDLSENSSALMAALPIDSVSSDIGEVSDISSANALDGMATHLDKIAWEPRRGTQPSYEKVETRYSYPTKQDCRDLYWQEQAHPTPAKEERDKEDKAVLEQVAVDGIGGFVGGVVGGFIGGPVGAGAGGVVGALLAEEGRLKGQREEEARDGCRENGKLEPWIKPNPTSGAYPAEQYGPIAPTPKE
ncbi:hypothetical protein [Gloeobacter morelensis]|uniref:Glycine zipper domain-containing protein n=1 Tax=Gloeobacter morelensis MG652769 TaxID=2781736 RepID=A0ABY3PPB1_9CYAN|nr:hypothetical protein [Gloeobacter morelensis]UFP95537.1 hypothetical protein ISF26_04630 [Gloeobacter morelensis MG652769]